MYNFIFCCGLIELIEYIYLRRITLSICSIQLQDKLAEKDKELKTIKLGLELQERATEAKIAEKTAGTVGEHLTDGHIDHTVPAVAI